MVEVVNRNSGIVEKLKVCSSNPEACLPTTLKLRQILIGLSMCLMSLSAAANDSQLSDVQLKGQNLAFERSKGNCLACHHIAGGTLAGTVAPPLIQMQARFPVREVLREQIADARIRNSKTIMPPFEAHGILTAEEVDAIVDFLYTL